MSSVIEHSITLALVDPSATGLLVPAMLVYERQDPFAVKLVFPGVLGPEDGDLTWHLSREMLEVGLLTSVGDGDVRVSPGHPGSVRLHLRSGCAEAVLETPSRGLERFLRACRTCVPPGTEGDAYDWDALLDSCHGP